MPLFLILACGWMLLVGTARALPDRFQWPMAWTLIGTGIPLLGVLTFQAGPVFGLAGLVVAVLMTARAVGRAARGAGGA